MWQTLLVSMAAFIGTNIDDLLIDTLLFAAACAGRERRSIVLGKYLGMAALVLFSSLLAGGVQLLPAEYIGWLGVLPIALGVKGLICRNHQEEGCRWQTGGTVLRTAALTVANGADNIGVYVPIFAGFDAGQMLLCTSVFALCIGAWCFLAQRLADIPLLRRALEKHGEWLAPVVFIALGAYILLENVI